MKIVYKNGTIYTGEVFADYFIVEDGVFQTVGMWSKESEEKREEIEKQVDKVVDLQGRFVCA